MPRERFRNMSHTDFVSANAPTKVLNKDFLDGGMAAEEKAREGKTHGEGSGASEDTTDRTNRTDRTGGTAAEAKPAQRSQRSEDCKAKTAGRAMRSGGETSGKSQRSGGETSGAIHTERRGSGAGAELRGGEGQLPPRSSRVRMSCIALGSTCE